MTMASWAATLGQVSFSDAPGKKADATVAVADRMTRRMALATQITRAKVGKSSFVFEVVLLRAEIATRYTRVRTNWRRCEGMFETD